MRDMDSFSQHLLHGESISLAQVLSSRKNTKISEIALKGSFYQVRFQLVISIFFNFCADRHTDIHTDRRRQNNTCFAGSVTIAQLSDHHKTHLNTIGNLWGQFRYVNK